MTSAIATTPSFLFLLVEMGSQELFVWAGLEPQSS
jgi:hypothetical protein